MIADIRTAMTELRYIVKNTRQEKIAPNERVVVIDDIEIEIVDTHTYKSYVWVAIEWDEMHPDNLPIEIPKLIKNLEERIMASGANNKTTFKFRQSQINPLGTTYRVTIIVEYVIAIDLEYYGE
ncbi:MAG: hypothetical protein WCS74_03780 [Dehalococcoidales bacterium]|jgi:hypothetical protein